MLKASACARFTGYRPCSAGRKCPERGELRSCPDFRPVEHTTLVVNLDNLGNVIQMTSLLPAVRRAHPGTLLTWVTDPFACPVFEGNPLVDRVMPYGAEAVSILGAMEFDLLLNVDKSRRAAALAATVKAREKRGFGLTRLGAIEPENPEAEYAYRLGLDDELKFRVNTKPGTQIAAEMFGLEWKRDPYVLELTDAEREFVGEYRRRHGLEGALVVGVNTGSSPAFPNKSMSVERHVELVDRIAKALPDAKMALVGGPHETEKNAAIAERASAPLLQTPTTEGVRRGILYVDACDVVVTGDTSGLHMGVALGKWVVAYFCVTCAQEIDLYDRGVLVKSGLDCSPCWRPECADPKCVREIDLDSLVEGVVAGRDAAASRAE
jgi:heptosyltransferase-2